MPGSTQSVTASWTSPYPGDEYWKRLVHASLFDEDIEVDEDEDEIYLGPVLGTADDRRVASASVERVEMDDETPTKHLHWRLRVNPQPSGDPPDYAVASDKRLAGREGLASFAREALAGVSAPIASLVVQFQMPRQRFRCSSLPREPQPVDAAVQELGSGVLIEQVGYRLRGGGVHGLEEIQLVYDHIHDMFVVVARARAPLQLGTAKWIPIANEMTDLLSAKLFEPVAT